MPGSAIYLAPSRTRRKSGDREKNVAVEKKMNRIGRGLSRSAVWPFIRLAKWNLAVLSEYPLAIELKFENIFFFRDLRKF